MTRQPPIALIPAASGAPAPTRVVQPANSARQLAEFGRENHLSRPFFSTLLATEKNDEGLVMGSAVMIGPGLALTARHVIDDCLEVHEGIEERPLGELESYDVNFHIHAFQFLDDRITDRWSVVCVYASGHTDVAVLHLKRETHYARQLGVDVTSFPGLVLVPPAAGDRVEAIGYPHGKVDYTPNKPIHLTLDPRVSVGEVKKVYELRRDSVKLPFPSFQTNAEFARGMSGGPVYDSRGSLCGIMCSSFNVNDAGDPISYASLLWPCCAIEIDLPLLSSVEPGTNYLLLELGRAGAIEMNGVERFSLVKNVASFDF